MHPYIVLKGESIRSIGEKFHVSPSAIARINSLSEDHALSVGQRLLVPVKLLRLERSRIPLQRLARIYQTPETRILETMGTVTILFC